MTLSFLSRVQFNPLKGRWNKFEVCTEKERERIISRSVLKNPKLGKLTQNHHHDRGWIFHQSQWFLFMIHQLSQLYINIQAPPFHLLCSLTCSPEVKTIPSSRHVYQYLSLYLYRCWFGWKFGLFSGILRPKIRILEFDRGPVWRVYQRSRGIVMGRGGKDNVPIQKIVNVVMMIIEKNEAKEWWSWCQYFVRLPYDWKVLNIMWNGYGWMARVPQLKLLHPPSVANVGINVPY